MYIIIYVYIIYIKVFFKQQTLTSLGHHHSARRLAKATNIFFINAESVICDLLISSGEGSFDEDILGWEAEGFYRFTRPGPLVFTYQKHTKIYG